MEVPVAATTPGAAGPVAGATNPRNTRDVQGSTPATPWPEQLIHFLNAASLQAGSVECCGLILGLRTQAGIQVERFSLCENHASEPEQGFRVPAGHLMEWDGKATELGLQIVGAWHSHPGGNPAPSAADLGELPKEWLGLIVVPSPEGAPQIQAYGRHGATPVFVHG